MRTPKSSLRIGLVVPHIFMHRDILPRVIFSPGTLALDLTKGFTRLSADVTLFSPGPIQTTAKNITADLSYFEKELAGRGDGYIDLLKKHPFTFITLARQVQSELITKAFAMANNNELDIVHIYTNEEDVALPYAQFCKKPVVFTHHDPFNFLVKYKSIFPKYAHLNWLSMSYAQRSGMPLDTNWVANIYHGIDQTVWQPNYQPNSDYVAYLGRLIEPKGVHLAIAAVKMYNQTAKTPLKLKIAGKHYAEHKKDTYWQTRIAPEMNNMIEYIGFIGDIKTKQTFLGNAKALLIPSVFDEPFGMGMIEALACGTPIIGLDSGAIPEVIKNGETGFLARKMEREDGTLNESLTAGNIEQALQSISQISRQACRKDFEARFTLNRMCKQHLSAYKQLILSQGLS